MNRIMRYTLESHRPHVIKRKDINGAIDIAVDQRKDIVRYTSYSYTRKIIVYIKFILYYIILYFYYAITLGPIISYF